MLSLAIANLAFSPALVEEAKLGIFAGSIVSAVASRLLLAASPAVTHPSTG